MTSLIEAQLAIGNWYVVDYNKYCVKSEPGGKNNFSFSEYLQYRYATTWDIILIMIGCVCTFVKALGIPVLFIGFSEFTTLLVDRALASGTSSRTIFLPIFGGGNIL